MIILNVNNLTVKFHQTIIFSDVNFSIEKGDYIGIVGPNGAGKTTLIKTLLGLIKPDTGYITFNIKSKIGYLPQLSPGQEEKFPITVNELLDTALFSIKSKKQRKKLINEILFLLKIENLKDKPFNKLSGGQKQKVLLARSLVNKPELLILDEPVNALDPASRDELYNLLKFLNKNELLTILLVTHDLASIGKYANKILYLDRKLVFYDTFENFCKSNEMTDYFGHYTQHLICQRHNI